MTTQNFSAGSTAPGLQTVQQSPSSPQSFQGASPATANTSLADPKLSRITEKHEGSAKSTVSEGSGIAKIHHDFARAIGERTGLADDTCELIAFWAISTWFQSFISISPCLVITGPRPQALLLFSILGGICSYPRRLIHFRRGDLKHVVYACTQLIMAQNLDGRTADLIGELTHVGFNVAEMSNEFVSSTRAIYVGESSSFGRIQNSIVVDLPDFTGSPCRVVAHAWMGYETANQKNMMVFREKIKNQVRASAFNPSGLTSEMFSVASALGNCLVGAPDLQARLVHLLADEDRQLKADRAASTQGLIASAMLDLFHRQPKRVLVKEITAETNRFLEARGQSERLSPEEIGRRLKKLGFSTQKSTSDGMSLSFEHKTQVHVHDVASAFFVFDSMPSALKSDCNYCLKYRQSTKEAQE